MLVVRHPLSAATWLLVDWKYFVFPEFGLVFLYFSFSVRVHVGSENTTVPPGSGLTGLTHTTSGAPNAASNDTGSQGYRVTNGETTVFNAAHSVEKYPED